MKQKLLFVLLYVLLSFLPTFGSAKIVQMDSENPHEMAVFVKHNREQFIKTINEKDFKGIEILIGDGTTKQLESLFGHASIRFLDSDDDIFNDMVISFQMLALDENQLISKMFGGWENLPHVMTLRETIYDYMRLQMRGLSRVAIPSTPSMIRELLLAISSAMIVPDVVGDYNFFSNNCLDGILKVLSSAGYPVIKISPLSVPSKGDLILKASFLSFFPKLYTESRAFDLFKQAEKEFDERSLYRKYTSHDRPFLDGDQFKSWIENLSDRDVQILHTFWPLEWTRKISLISERYSQVKETVNLKDLLALDSYPDSFYQICEQADLACRNARMQDIINYWEKEDLKVIVRQIDYQSRLKLERERAMQLINNQVAASLSFSHPLISDLVGLENDLIREFVEID